MGERHWLKKDEIALKGEDEVTCDECGKSVFVHDKRVFCGEECLRERLASEETEEDLVEKWRNTYSKETPIKRG